MKKISLLLVSAFILTACTNSSNQENEAMSLQEEEEMESMEPIGGDKDAHGCLIAAGETWSQLKQDCIRVFEDALRLNPIEIEEDEAIISAFVLVNEEATKAELFIESEEQSILLDAKDENSYENEKYQYNLSDKTLFIDGKESYKAN